MVVYKCKSLPDEGECIHIPPHLSKEDSVSISADIHRFLPRVVSLELEHNFSGWYYFNVSYLDEEGDERKVHISGGSYIIKRSDTDWAVYPENTFKKMYNLIGPANEGPLDNVITW